MLELQPKIRRSGSSGTVIELLPMHVESVQIDISQNQPASVLPDSNTVTPSRKTAIKPIIKNKINHHHYQQNIYYVDDPSDQPPPPPPHAHEWVNTGMN